MLETIGDAFGAYRSGQMWQIFSDSWIVLRIAVLAVLIGFVLAAVWWLRRLTRSRRALRTWIAIEAKVVRFSGYRRDPERSGRMDYWLGSYEYQDYSGRSHRGDFTEEHEAPWEGQVRTVYVNPRRPSQSLTTGRADVSPAAVVSAVAFWLVMLAVALFFYLFLATL